MARKNPILIVWPIHMPQHVRRILFIRLSAIGDIVMASGLPSSIKKAYTGADAEVQLTWLVEAPYAGLVSNHPYVDNVIVWPKTLWKQLYAQRKYWQLLKAILAFRKMLHKEKYSVAIEAQGLLKSAFFAFISGARTRIGFVSKEKSHLFLTSSTTKPTSNKISSEYRHLATFIASLRKKSRPTKENASGKYTLCIEVSHEVTVSATAKCKRLNINQPFIVLAPFTTRAQKHWPLAHWQTLIGLMRQYCDLPIAILGGPKDAAQSESLTFQCDRVASFSGYLSLEESVSIVQQCCAFVGVDTGLTHLATAFNKPTVAIFGSTRPYTITDNALTTVLYEDMPCAPCKRRPTCNGRFDCLQQLSVQRVWESLQASLK